MHWDKCGNLLQPCPKCCPSISLARPKPYQGVRVRDPVKELLRRKRSLELQSTKTAPPAVDAVNPSGQSSYAPVFSSDGGVCHPAEASDAAQQGWRAPPGAGAGLQLGATPWSPTDCGQQDGSTQPMAYSATPALAADVYMQTLCPSYTMLTYTHTPLLTNFGTIPMAPAQATLPQMELPDSGLTYLPWAQPLTTISTMSNPGVQFAASAAALPASPLVHMPLSMSLTTMIPQPDPQTTDPELHQDPHPQLDCELPDQPLDEDSGSESESPSLLDKLLEERKAEEEGVKDSYRSSLFIPNV
ncbi:POU domain class 2-associating factor 1 isoform X2 [Takifugu rubripes]|uniref:OCA domain-containing protein n=1 Tax=Takifugu rubripes TaxID=31033 RepID=A0A674MWU6_TAKRU|nr:POU domain class 2-associating factor 1 isoform X2 [Takifugu rubripes]